MTHDELVERVVWALMSASARLPNEPASDFFRRVVAPVAIALIRPVGLEEAAGLAEDAAEECIGDMRHGALYAAAQIRRAMAKEGT